MELRWNEKGLLPAIAQDMRDGSILMQAWINQEALEQTLRIGTAHFFSRSRNCLWEKGETSGNTIAVREVWTDCDQDCVLYLGLPTGPSCHTGTFSCFMNAIKQERNLHLALPRSHVATLLHDTFDIRQKSTSEKSYVKSLFDKGPKHIASKIREEANELAVEVEKSDRVRTVSEAADLVFHTMVGLHTQGIAYDEVLSELSRRFGKSGHQEKAERG